MAKQNITLKKIKKPIRMVYINKATSLPDSIHKVIDDNWNKLISSGKKFTRGDVFMIESLEEESNFLQINVSLTDYAHYLATTENILGIERYRCRLIHTSVLIKTTDNFLVFGEMAENTSTPNQLQCAGGGITREDLLSDNIISIDENAKRELFEETGLVCGGSDYECDVKFTYIKNGGESGFMSAIYFAEVSLDANEVKNVFKNHNQNIIDNGDIPEFSKLIYLKNNKSDIDSFIESNKKPFGDYMVALLYEQLV